MTKEPLPKTKVCADCGSRKPLEKFGHNPRMKFGRKSYCLECNAARQRALNLRKRKMVLKQRQEDERLRS